MYLTFERNKQVKFISLETSYKKGTNLQKGRKVCFNNYDYLFQPSSVHMRMRMRK